MERSPGPNPVPDGRLTGVEREVSLRERLIARDERALAELVEIASPWMLNVAKGMLHDEDEAEEVVMEAFRTAWNNVAPAGEGYPGLMPYLLRITRHRAIDRLRGRRRRERKIQAAALMDDRTGAVAPVEPDEAGRPGWHVHTQVHSALDGLPPDQRAVVRLAYFDGLTQSEIAAGSAFRSARSRPGSGSPSTGLRPALAGLKDWVL